MKPLPRLTMNKPKSGPIAMAVVLRDKTFLRSVRMVGVKDTRGLRAEPHLSERFSECKSEVAADSERSIRL